MKDIIKKIGTVLPLIAVLGMASGALGAGSKENMCVKQKDGTYKCKASGKIMKEPCCNKPEGETKQKK